MDVKRNYYFSSRYNYLFIIFLVFASCVPQKKLKYARETHHSKTTYENIRKQKTIRPFDELYIKILSIDEETAQIFYNPNEMRGISNLNLLSYLVNENGNIDFPFVGKILVKNLTLDQAGQKIQNSLEEYLPNTEVVVKYVNNQITILGEVERQGEYVFVDDKITIFQALGLAGGISRYGNRENVVLVRDMDNKITYHEIDLTRRNVVESPYYYLLPDDLIIVEPLRAKSWSYQNVTYSTLLSTVTTVLAILYFFNAR
ncbi:MAG: polysaccharide biosynthesis/export family protein [Cyclobacteriaceae bacterium]